MDGAIRDCLLIMNIWVASSAIDAHNRAEIDQSQGNMNRQLQIKPWLALTTPQKGLSTSFLGLGWGNISGSFLFASGCCTAVEEIKDLYSSMASTVACSESHPADFFTA